MPPSDAMPHDETQDSAAELIERSPPIAFFLSAESFLRTAIHAHKATESATLKLRFDMPVYYLYSRPIELTLKAFLRAKGFTTKELANPRRWGHDLLKLWDGCVERGLTLDTHSRLTTGTVIDILAPYAASYEFRYTQTGAKTLPTLDAVMCSTWCTGVRELQSRRGKGRGERLWPWSRLTGWLAVHAVMEASGLDGPQASPNGLRHGFGVAAVSAGIPLNLAQKWLGHAQLTTTVIDADAIGAEEKDIARRMWA